MAQKQVHSLFRGLDAKARFRPVLTIGHVGRCRGGHLGAGRLDWISIPKGFMPLIRTVFGYLPRPHSLKDPKSLYQSPSGANGSDLTKVCNRRRSESGIRRFSTLTRRCCQKPRGRSEKRIFGNSCLPENHAYEVLSGFLLFSRLLLFQKSAVVRSLGYLWPPARLAPLVPPR